MTSSKNGWKAFIITLSLVGVLIMAIGSGLWASMKDNAEDIGKLKDFHGVDYRDAQSQLGAIRTDLALLIQARKSDSVAIAKIQETLEEIR